MRVILASLLILFAVHANATTPEQARAHVATLFALHQPTEATTDGSEFNTMPPMKGEPQSVAAPSPALVWIQKQVVPPKGLVLVHYGYPSCGPCKTMDKTVLSNKQVIERLAKLDACVNWNVQKKRAVGVKYVPKDAIYRDGKRVALRSSGVPSIKSYLAWIDTHAQQKKGG